MRKQGTETWAYFPKLCGDLEMRVLTMRPYQDFSYQCLPLSSLKSRSPFSLLSLMPFWFSECWYHKLLCTASSRLPVSHLTVSQVQEKLCPAQGPGFAKEVTVGLLLAEAEKWPRQRPLLLAWFPLGSAEGEINLYKSDPLSGTKYQQQTKTRPKAFVWKDKVGQGQGANLYSPIQN